MLKTWPDVAKPLVQFEQSHPALDQLVSVETRLPAGPIWLCRIGGDGLGREVRSRTVRPGRKYIVLSETPLPTRYNFLASCNVDCHGIHAAVLSMPDNLSFEIMTKLQELGLQVARTVRIFPVGLSARAFDGEGYSEWLTTEAPCFGIIHDHPVDTYSLRLDGKSETLIEVPAVNTPVFVKIAPLPAGKHTVKVSQDGYKAWIKDVSVLAESEVTLKAALTKN